MIIIDFGIRVEIIWEIFQETHELILLEAHLVLVSTLNLPKTWYFPSLVILMNL